SQNRAYITTASSRVGHIKVPIPKTDHGSLGEGVKARQAVRRNCDDSFIFPAFLLGRHRISHQHIRIAEYDGEEFRR
ncbi:MAG: hypothetical protein WCF15_11470, partial [Pseudolabrys sp.]